MEMIIKHRMSLILKSCVLELFLPQPFIKNAARHLVFLHPDRLQSEGELH
jgi:hypothetical protein